MQISFLVSEIPAQKENQKKKQKQKQKKSKYNLFCYFSGFAWNFIAAQQRQVKFLQDAVDLTHCCPPTQA